MYGTYGAYGCCPTNVGYGAGHGGGGLGYGFAFILVLFILLAIIGFAGFGRGGSW